MKYQLVYSDLKNNFREGFLKVRQKPGFFESLFSGAKEKEVLYEARFEMHGIFYYRLPEKIRCEGDEDDKILLLHEHLQARLKERQAA